MAFKWWRFGKKEPGILTRDDLIAMLEQKAYSLPELMPNTTNYPQWNKWDADKAIDEGYEASVWVYACVEKRTTAAASVPWVVERRNGDDWDEVPDHPLAQLIRTPNPAMDWALLMSYTIQHMDLAGNAYWTEVRGGNGGLPLELWPLKPSAIKTKGGREQLIDFYEYTDSNVTRRIMADDMVHLMNPAPGSFLFGQSPLKAGGRATDIDREAEIFQKVALQNRGVSDLAIMLDPETTPEQYERLKAAWSDNQGGPRNARKPLWTTRDVKTLGQTSADMDYIEGRRFIRDEICAAFGVPPPMVGNYDKATLANIETARQIFWRDTMIPLLDRIMSQLNIQLASEFGPDIRLRYDTSNVDALRENMKEKVETARTLWSMGVPLNVINQRLELGFDDIDGGDIGYLPAGLLPTDFVGAPMDSPEQLGEDPGVDAAGQPSPAQGGNVQQQALNGAQMAALQEIAQAVADGLLPQDTAITLILISIPFITEEQARDLIDPAVGFVSATSSEPTPDEARSLAELAYGRKDGGDG